MPYIYATDNGQIAMQNGPAEHLAPDLAEVEKPVASVKKSDSPLDLNQKMRLATSSRREPHNGRRMRHDPNHRQEWEDHCK
jgi:hypothetical protein